MRVSVPPPSLATQTAPAAATAPHGLLPVTIRATGCGAARTSTRESTTRPATVVVTPARPERFHRMRRVTATAPLFTLDDVQRARERIAGRLHRTPMLTSRTLSERTNAHIHFKAELLQRTGSFKPRGVLNKLATLSEDEKARGVISISAGNHAQALAYASAVEGIDALVVMWQTASPTKIAAARGYGATVDDTPPDMPAAFEYLDRLVEETGRTLVHPYDDPLVMAGQGTVGLEMLEDVPEADTVLVQVGGGGLVSGIATAVRGLNPDARIFGIEPERSNALAASMAAGKSVTVEPGSLADGLNGPYAGPNCVRVCLGLGVESII